MERLCLAVGWAEDKHCRRSTEQCGTVVVRADAGDLLPNKAERALGRWLCKVLVI